MPAADDIQRQLRGAWQLMNGKPEGISLLDISADGFWNSFFAIVIALPVLITGWVPVIKAIASCSTERLTCTAKLAVIDIGTWILPIFVLALSAGYIGIRDRFVHFVVANNWASALFAWFMLPVFLLRLTVPEAGDLALGMSLGISLVSLVLSWRLTNTTLGKGPAIASSVFGIMMLLSIIILLVLQDLLGIVPV